MYFTFIAPPDPDAVRRLGPIACRAWRAFQNRASRIRDRIMANRCAAVTIKNFKLDKDQASTTRSERLAVPGRPDPASGSFTSVSEEAGFFPSRVGGEKGPTAALAGGGHRRPPWRASESRRHRAKTEPAAPRPTSRVITWRANGSRSNLCQDNLTNRLGRLADVKYDDTPIWG
jgi:hypothetical protein